jgi:hypothetical protein
MSANLDLVRSICADWERGDFSSTEWAHAEIEFTRPDGPAPGTWTGIAGMADGWRDVLGAWENVRLVAEEYRNLDDERVLVLMRMAGRGKASGLDLSETLTKGATLFRIRDGEVTRLDAYARAENALADLGLPAEGGSP